MLPASRASTGYTDISSSDKGGPVQLLAFDVLPRHDSSRYKVLIPVPPQGYPARCILHRIASHTDIAYRRRRAWLHCLAYDLHVAAGCNSLRPETNKRRCMTPSGAFFLSLPPSNPRPITKTDVPHSPLSRSQYIWAPHGPPTPIRRRFTSPFDVGSASVEHLVEKDGGPMALVGRKGGIYAGNVPPTTARSRNKLSCRRLRRASEAMAAKRDAPKQT